MPTPPATFRLRPRFAGVAGVSMAVGTAVGAVGLMFGSIIGPIIGVAGLALGASYLASPTWRLRLNVDDDGIEVVGRFRLAWGDVKRILASPSTSTCFVDGGTAARSILVPGEGAPAPYTLDDRAGAYRAIVARAPAHLITLVERLADPVAPPA